MKKSDLKILFMGTPDFALATLEKLVSSGFNVCGVYTKPDMPSNRGLKYTMSPVKEYAISKGILIFQPEKLKTEQSRQMLKNINPDVIVVAAYGKILPTYILNYPKYGCINIHGSILPKYRGAAPIQWAVINGDNETGVSIMYMDEGMDTGEIISVAKTTINNLDTAKTIYEKLQTLGADEIVRVLDEIISTNNLVESKPQVGEATYAPMLEKENTKIDFGLDGKSIVNLIRGANPTPAAWCKLDDMRQYKIYTAEQITTNQYDNYENGVIVSLDDKKNQFYVKCKDGVVNICELKPANSKQMKASEYIRGKKVKLGEKFV